LENSTKQQAENLPIENITIPPPWAVKEKILRFLGLAYKILENKEINYQF
jgi:hypothetical protein